jgi:hypothetical protein
MNYVQRVEMGLNLTVHSIVKFCNALQTPPASLFEQPNKRDVSAGRPRSPGRPRNKP